MNDVLIPHLKAVFDLSFFQAGLVQFSFFIAFFIISLLYFVISATREDPISRIGYKNGVIIGLILCGLGCCLFYPAAHFQLYGFFLSALFVLASGVTILQIAANPYAAILGSEETASSRLNLAQGFNSFGTTLAPVVGAILIYKVFSDGEVTANALKAPYLIYGSLFFALALLVSMVKLPSFVNKDEIQKGVEVLRHRHLLLGMVAIFMYVGGEVTVGSYLISFFQLDHIMGLSEADGGRFLAYYWGGAMIGRFLGSISMGSMTDKTKKYLIMAGLSAASFLVVYLITGIKNDGGRFYLELLPFGDVALFIVFLVLNFLAFLISGNNPARTLAIFSSIVVVLLCLMVSGSGVTVFWSAIAIGAFNSILWSNIFTLAIRNLGKHTSQGSSLLVMMIVGGAIIPPLQGAIADHAGIQLSFALPIVCYLYILSYGLWGHRVQS